MISKKTITIEFIKLITYYFLYPVLLMTLVFLFPFIMMSIIMLIVTLMLFINIWHEATINAIIKNSQKK
jgi:hypothetical protein